MKSLIVLFLCVSFIPQNAESFFRSRVLMEDQAVTWSKPWIKLGKTEQESIVKLLRILKSSPTGKRIYTVAKAKLQKQNMTFFDLLSSGDTSLTDTTLIRRFSPSDPMDVQYQTKSKITLNYYHNTFDALLDLAHELTHFNYRGAFNPYRQGFNWRDFVKSTVEGKGGEVEAYMVECKIMRELRPDHFSNGSRCLKITEQRSGKLSKLLAKRQFYKVGKHYDRFKGRLKDFRLDAKEIDFPLSDGDSLFLSSAYGLPYPLAALEEYAVIMSTVCQNDLKRIDLIRRGPASQSPETQSYLRDFEIRCNNFISK